MIKFFRKLRSHPQFADGWSPKVISLIIGMHALAAAGAFFFSREGLFLAIVLYYISGMGVTGGYHRLLTHEAFKTYRWIRNSFAIAGALSGEGEAVGWIFNHRKHHQHSDTKEDPHSPDFLDFWGSHVVWTMARTTRTRYHAQTRRYCEEEAEDRFFKWLKRSYVRLHFGLIALLAVGGFLYGGWFYGFPYGGLYYALSFVGYGYFVRIIVVLNSTWAVNSFSHMYGSQPYLDCMNKKDNSRNNWIVAFFAIGEGWHHNHHVCPTAYRHGERWWQYDLTAVLIEALWFFGLAWDLKPFRIPKRARKREEEPVLT